eukprot:4658563-Heterocapsa_arctica.AAC.1
MSVLPFLLEEANICSAQGSQGHLQGPISGSVSVLGDFNFEMDLEDRVNLKTGRACGKAGQLADAWLSESGSLAELHQSDPTRAPLTIGAIRTASRTYCIYCSLRASVLRDMDISVHAIGSALCAQGRCSDHVPVAALLRSRQKSPCLLVKRIAPWICKHPAFHSYLDKGLANERLPVCPWAALKWCKILYQKAAEYVRARCQHR